MIDTAKFPHDCLAVLQSKATIFSDLVALTQLNVRSDFRYANLSGVDFSSSDLTNYDFTGACLRNADLSRAKADSAIFENADLRGALLNDSIRPNPQSVTYIIERELDIRSKISTLSGAVFDCAPAAIMFYHISIGALNADVNTIFTNSKNMFDYYRMVINTSNYDDYIYKYYRRVKECIERVAVPHVYIPFVAELFGILKSDLRIVVESLMFHAASDDDPVSDREFAVVLEELPPSTWFTAGRVPLCYGVIVCLAMRKRSRRDKP